MQGRGFDSQRAGSPHDLTQIICQLFVLGFELRAKFRAADFVGDVSSIPMPAIQQARGGQSLVHMVDGVLVHGQLSGQFPHAGQPLAGLQFTTGRRPSRSDLPVAG